MRRENRIKAYRYIVELIGQISQDLNQDPEKLTRICEISLDDLAKLQAGVSDPSRELVEALKKFSNAVSTDLEIDRYLVTPFLLEEPFNSNLK